jgi:hypothetical protein
MNKKLLHPIRQVAQKFQKYPYPFDSKERQNATKIGKCR